MNARPGSASQTSPRGGGEPRQQREQRRDVAALVEHVGGEHERPRRPERRGVRVPAEDGGRDGQPVVRGIARGHRHRVGRPVGGEHAPARRGGGERGQPEPAAQLHHTPPGERAARDHARQRHRARPQLRPVRQELLLCERLLAQQRLAVARGEHEQLAPGQRDDVLDEVLHRPDDDRHEC